MDAADRRPAKSTFGQSKDVGQDATKGTRQLDLRASRQAHGCQRADSQVGAEHPAAKGTQAVVPMGYGIQKQVGQGSDRQGTPYRTCPGGTGSTDEHVRCGDHEGDDRGLLNGLRVTRTASCKLAQRIEGEARIWQGHVEHSIWPQHA